jgi:hypothetical protein
MGEWMNEWVMGGWMDECMNEWMDEWMHEWMDECMNGCMDGRKDGRMEGQTHEWTNEWMNECGMEKLPLYMVWVRTSLVFLGVCENGQQEAHFFSLIYFNWTILYMFGRNNCSSPGGYFCTWSI